MISSDPSLTVDPDSSGDPRSDVSSYLNDEIWTVKEAADYLKVSEYSLRYLCMKKKIPHFRVGDKLIRFTGAEIRKWKQKQENRNFR